MKRLVYAVLLMFTVNLAAYDETHKQTTAEQQYTFSWPYSDGGGIKPRGGTTKGSEIKLDKTPGSAWQSIQEPQISKRERDRRAILAMAGPYRVSFDFIETVGFTADYVPDRPYQSWGTEYIYVLADEERFISLQHIMVMFFDMGEGVISEPVVIKHWRQDWRYENTSITVYAGHQGWQRKTFTPEQVQGSWSQAVYQVDDSPRYQAIGSWRHEGGYSSWQSEQTWRPLPRREYSVRNDYHVLVGTNRHTITPTGWVQEEDNLKTVLTDAGLPDPIIPYLAREAGLARYERIVDHDFSAGDLFWQQTSDFWLDVRQAWQQIQQTKSGFRLKRKVDDRELYKYMFEYADKLSEADYDPAQGREFIQQTLKRFIEY